MAILEEKNINFVILLNNEENELILFKNKLYGLNNIDKRFKIVNRFEDNTDNYDQITKYLRENKGCSSINFFDSMYASHLVIFINDLANVTTENPYCPLCIASIDLYDNYVTSKKFIFINGICSEQKYKGCGTTLMNIIKYLSTLLNCDEIRLQSVGTKNTLNFYEKNKFNEVDERKYTHYYVVTQEDSKFDPFHYEVKGDVSYIEPSSQLSGGKSKKNKSKKIKSKKNKSKKNRSKK